MKIEIFNPQQHLDDDEATFILGLFGRCYFMNFTMQCHDIPGPDIAQLQCSEY